MQCLYVCREAGDVGARRAKSPPDFLDVEKGIEAWNKQTIKGQSISKGFFGVYQIIEQKQVDLKYHIVVKSNSFIRFLEGMSP